MGWDGSLKGGGEGVIGLLKGPSVLWEFLIEKVKGFDEENLNEVDEDVDDEVEEQVGILMHGGNEDVTDIFLLFCGLDCW